MGDSLETMKLSKIICVACFTIKINLNFLIYFQMIIHNNIELSTITFITLFCT